MSVQALKFPHNQGKTLKRRLEDEIEFKIN
jgi:hypothetical protein